MGSHLINGSFQSDKYPTTPSGKVPLSTKDPTAQNLLWQYAQRRRAVDAEFSDDLETALILDGYKPPRAFMVAPSEAQRIIGPGGKTIMGIVDATNVVIDVELDGHVSLLSNDPEGLRKVLTALGHLLGESAIQAVIVAARREFKEALMACGMAADAPEADHADCLPGLGHLLRTRARNNLPVARAIVKHEALSAFVEAAP